MRLPQRADDLVDDPARVVAMRRDGLLGDLVQLEVVEDVPAVLCGLSIRWLCA